METIIWAMDHHPVMFWSVVTIFSGAAVAWVSLTWEAVQLLDDVDLHGGLDK